MADKTGIQWTNATWNPTIGCAKVSAGCKNCYAERMAKRLAGRYGYPQSEPFKPTIHLSRLDEPLRWRKPRMVFVCSMGDLFHEDVPPEWITTVVNAIRQANRKNWQHKWLFLTKRPENITRWINWCPDHRAADAAAWFQKKAWVGVTAENQKLANERIPILLGIPAAVRFVSIEPMLGPVDPWLPEKRKGFVSHVHGKGVDWVICGGETGPGARPMHPGWARSLRDQCESSDVPFFFKSWGDWAACKPAGYCEGMGSIGYLGDGSYRFDQNMRMKKIGKKRTGRLLDGKEWGEYPNHPAEDQLK